MLEQTKSLLINGLLFYVDKQTLDIQAGAPVSVLAVEDTRRKTPV